MPDEKSTDFDQPLTEDEKNVKLSPDDKATLHEMDDEKHGPEFYSHAPGTGKGETHEPHVNEGTHRG